MTDLEEHALQALGLGIKWKLDGEPCWCTCERRKAWKEGKKQHTAFCREAHAVHDRLLDEAVANPPLDDAENCATAYNKFYNS